MTWSGAELFGREDLLERAQQLLHEPGQRGACFIGPPGIGKSRLVREIVDRVGRDGADRGEDPSAGWSVVWITGSAATSDIPLAAFAPLLPPGSTDAGLPAILFVRSALEEQAAGKPLLLVVDDAHQLDEASAALVHQLILGTPARLLVTQRSATPAPDPVTRLWRDQLVERIDVGPLGRASVADLAAALLGGPIEPASAMRLVERAGGNPLYTRELVIAGSDGGEWRSTPAGWRWEPGDAQSPRLADLLADRLAGLQETQRELLVHLAFGEPLGIAEVRSLADDSDIDALERSGLITAMVDGKRLAVTFTHRISADLVRRTVSPLRARLVRTSLAEMLVATGARRRSDDMRLALLALDAGVELDAAVLQRAARTALFGGDRALSIRLAEQGFLVRPTFELGHTLADALYEDGDFGPIEAHWPSWSALAESDEQRTYVAMHQAISHFYRNADRAAASAVIDEIRAVVPPGVWRDEVDALDATLLMVSGRVAESFAVARTLLEGRGPDRVLIQASLAATHDLRAMGSGMQALAVAERAQHAFDQLGDLPSMVSNAVLGLVVGATLNTLGRPREALARCESARESAWATGDASAEGLSELIRSESLGMLGLLNDARAAARASEAAFIRVRHTAFRRWAVEARAQVAVLADDADGLDEALNDLDRLGPHPALLFDHARIVAESWRTARRDGSPAACAELATGAAQLELNGDIAGAMLCWYEMTRHGESGAGEPLRRLAEQSDSPLHHALAAHAAAFELGDAEALGRAAEGLNEAGAVVWAIGAATQAAAAATDPRHAARWTHQAATWAAGCDGLSAAGAVAEPAAITPLTRREREVSLLAAQGLSARAIAERLFVSFRTVENHLARSYVKLGVSSRAELAHALAAG